MTCLVYHVQCVGCGRDSTTSVADKPEHLCRACMKQLHVEEHRRLGLYEEHRYERTHEGVIEVLCE
jgi:hypothetical protein